MKPDPNDPTCFKLDEPRHSVVWRFCMERARELSLDDLWRACLHNGLVQRSEYFNFLETLSVPVPQFTEEEPKSWTYDDYQKRIAGAALAAEAGLRAAKQLRAEMLERWGTAPQLPRLDELFPKKSQ